MDFNLNEYPTGGFFGGGYDGSVLADGLDTGKNQATGSPLVYIRNLSPTALQATSSNLGFYALTVFACKKYLQNYSQKKGLIFVYVVAFQKMLALRCYLIQFEKKRIMAI